MGVKRRRRRALWRVVRRTGAAMFLIVCFFLGGSFDRLIAPSRNSGFALEDAAMGLGLGILLLSLVRALAEATREIFRKIRGIS